MSAQAPATNNVAPSADQANQVQSQEVEAPQNAQTQQPQASTSNNSQSTWDSVAPAQYKGVSPANAPESVQDAAAVKLYNTGGAGHWVTA